MWEEEAEITRLVAIYKLLEKKIQEEIAIETGLSIPEEKVIELMVSSRFALFTLANSIAERTYGE